MIRAPWVVAGVLLVAACSSGDEGDGGAPGLVLVHDVDGGEHALATYTSDGTRVTSFSVGERIWQPVWSPDGARVAWASTTDGEGWELVSESVDGGDRRSVPLPGLPDYLAYDPSGTRMLALTPSPSGFGLVVVPVDADAESTPFEVVDLGQPYFSDFAPEGDEVVAHVGSDVRIVDLDGDRRSLDAISTRHQTPAWHPTDDVVFYAVDVPDGSRLVRHDLAAGEVEELARFPGFVFFDLDPSGRRIAVSAFAPTGDDGDLRAFRAQAPGDVLDGGLYVVEVTDGSVTQLADRPTVAPVWDPTGERVLVRDRLDGTGRWTAYSIGGDGTSTPELDLDTSLMPVYLPFWDQYVRGQTVWSPDGARFVHVGEGTAGTGVWVHDVDADTSSFLADGDVAFWSPS